MVENSAITLVKLITALYYNNHAPDKSPTFDDEVRVYLDGIKLERSNQTIGGEDEIVAALKITAEWMLKHSGNMKFTPEGVLQRVRLNAKGDNYYTENLEETFKIPLDEDKCNPRVTEIMSELRFEQHFGKLKNFIANAHRQLNFGHEYKDPAQYARALTVELEQFSDGSEGKLPGYIGGVDFTNLDSIEEVLAMAVKSNTSEGRLKTGFRGWDQATDGGYKRGDLINYGALTHHYKSGKLLDDFLFIPVHNEPFMIDANKKPLVSRVSFENTPDQDIIIVYKRLHEIKYGEKLDKANINTMKAAQEIAAWFGQSGYYVRMDCFNPQNFSIYDLQAYYMNLDRKGFETHLASVDYLAQIAHNTMGDRMDVKIQRTLDITRMFAFPRHMTVTSGHQLSTRARDVALESPRRVPRSAIEGAMYWETKSLSTKLDVEFTQHIVEGEDGGDYLMVERGKCRGGEDVPKEHRSFVYKFQKIGGLKSDYDDDSLLLRKLPRLDLDEIINYE